MPRYAHLRSLRNLLVEYMGMETTKNVFISEEERAPVKKACVKQIQLTIREKLLRAKEKAR